MCALLRILGEEVLASWTDGDVETWSGCLPSCMDQEEAGEGNRDRNRDRDM